MRKCRCIFTALLFILILSLSSLSALAQEMWSEDYYRAYDETGTLSDEEKEDIDRTACDFIEEYHYDLVCMTVTSDSFDASLEDVAEAFYTGNGFGYGEDASGIILAYNADTSEVVFLKFGSAVDEVDDTFLTFLKKQLPQYYDSHQAFGVMYVFEKYMQDYEDGVYDEALGRTAAAGITTEEGISPGAEIDVETEIEDMDPDLAAFRECVEHSGIERVGDGKTNRPFWYPVSTDNFPFYNDPDIPRVVDAAGIFTDEEKARMKELIDEITDEAGADIVVFTDTSNYHLGNNVYAADFYDFNGYGFGDENEGICLMICMDPSYRGWYVCATGTDTRSLYTETSADALDDKLYEYMSAGNYGQGVIDWIRNIGTLYKKGIPFAPDWCPDRNESVSSETAAAAPRVVDYADLFTEEEIEELSAQAAELSDRYGHDVVINTAVDDYSLGKDAYCDLFYEKNGYGLGKDHAGYCLTLFSNGEMAMTGYGSAKEKLSEVNYDRICNYTSEDLEMENYYWAAGVWLKQIEHMERTGRVMRPMMTWGIHAVIAALIAFVLSLAALNHAKKKMETVKLAKDADAYIVGQPVLTKISDIYLRTTTTRRQKPKITGGTSSHRSSSGSSHSSYSSSYKGSSGRSHSGSGRRF